MPRNDNRSHYGQYANNVVERERVTHFTVDDAEPNRSRIDQYLNDEEEANRGKTPQYTMDDDELNTTTDSGSDDYLAHDIESVDRLALDGETREPLNSSTIDAYNY